MSRSLNWDKRKHCKIQQYKHFTDGNTLRSDDDATCIGSDETSSESMNSLQAQYASDRGIVIPYEELQISGEEKIGHGGFGDVYAAYWRGAMVAVKRMRFQRPSKKRLYQFQEEVSIFCRLNHKNIISFYGVCIELNNLAMVMEFMQGSLFDKLHIEEHQFLDSEKLHIIREIACGLQYLHQQGVTHCDIKSTNILLDVFDHDCVFVKLADFGLSLIKNEAESSTSSREVTCVGTPRYSAPEVLRGEFLSREQMMMADIYSFGLVIWEVLSEEEPYEELNVHQLRLQVGFGDMRPLIDGMIEDVDIILIRFIQSCWSKDPVERPTADALEPVLRQAQL